MSVRSLPDDGCVGREGRLWGRSWVGSVCPRGGDYVWTEYRWTDLPVGRYRWGLRFPVVWVEGLLGKGPRCRVGEWGMDRTPTTDQQYHYHKSQKGPTVEGGSPRTTPVLVTLRDRTGTVSGGVRESPSPPSRLSCPVTSSGHSGGDVGRGVLLS